MLNTLLSSKVITEISKWYKTSLLYDICLRTRSYTSGISKASHKAFSATHIGWSKGTVLGRKRESAVTRARPLILSRSNASKDLHAKSIQDCLESLTGPFAGLPALYELIQCSRQEAKVSNTIRVISTPVIVLRYTSAMRKMNILPWR